MARQPIFEWDAMPYAFEEKGADWYWALGIIALAGIVACVLFNNILLALVIAAAAVSVALQAAKHPREHHFAITEQGVTVDGILHTYESMISFSVLEYADEALPPSLSIKTRNLVTSHLIVPIIDHDPMEIYEFFLHHVDEGSHHNSAVDRIIEMLRF